ncbi:hypothetical protein Chor_002541 [Crotalus horridus]
MPGEAPNAFFTFLLVIFALEVGAAIWGFANKEKLNCCGPVGVPEPDYQDTCPENPMPCPKAIEDFFKNKLNVIAAVGIAVAVVMIFGMIFSMILCCAIRRDREMV